MFPLLYAHPGRGFVQALQDLARAGQGASGSAGPGDRGRTVFRRRLCAAETASCARCAAAPAAASAGPRRRPSRAGLPGGVAGRAQTDGLFDRVDATLLPVVAGLLMFHGAVMVYSASIGAGPPPPRYNVRADGEKEGGKEIGRREVVEWSGRE